MNKINCSKYNNQLIARGQITFWFDKNISEKWYAETKDSEGGRYKDTYSDDAITALSTLKY